MTTNEYISSIKQNYDLSEQSASKYKEAYKNHTSWCKARNEAIAKGDEAEMFKAEEQINHWKSIYEYYDRERLQYLEKASVQSDELYSQYGYGYAPWNDPHVYTPEEMNKIDNGENVDVNNNEDSATYEAISESEEKNDDKPSETTDSSENNQQVNVVSGTNAASNAPSSSNASANAQNSGDISVDQSKIVENAEKIGEGKGLDFNMVKNKGVVYPIIRINDHICAPSEIQEFYIESGYFKNYHDWTTLKFPKTGFVPTMHLVLNTSSPDLLKSNQIKSGDKAAIFFHNGGGMVKSYRGDYTILSVMTSDKPSEMMDQPVTYIIEGELCIPNLRNETEKFNFNGSSRDAMMDCSQRLGLNFFFCDPDDTQDYQGWVCSKNLLEYALEVSSHAWKEFNAFYDCWIDPRYGLSFINVNKMLVEDGLDEPLDLTPFINTINKSVGIDGEKMSETEEKKRIHTQPQAKMITNIVKDDDSVTPFYIRKWNIVNKASEIAAEIGINQQQSMNIDNPGVETDNTNIDMSYSIPINTTKLQNGFFVLVGPGVNITYTQADQKDPNQSFVKNSYKMMGGGIVETMSNDDAEQMQTTGDNMYSSGNTNRFYDAGWEHNMRNNLQLQKQYTEVELLGCNLGIMRGEKIPALIVDIDKVQSASRAGNYTGSAVQNAIYESASGWYIIDGIMWYWSQNAESSSTTMWTTKLKLVRREWPIPGHEGVATTEQNNVNIQTTVDVNGGNVKNGVDVYDLPEVVVMGTRGGNSNTSASSLAGTSAGVSVEGLGRASNYSTGVSTDTGTGRGSSNPDSQNTAQTDVDRSIIGTVATSALKVDSTDTTGSGEVPLTGLTESLKDVYFLLKNICPNIKLVSARRWAVDESGKRVEGNAFVTRNGMYKCVNAKGEVMYFKSNNSRHLYGQAFDIVNSNGQDFNGIMTNFVMMDNNLLKTMVNSGVAACIEQTTDDSGAATKHYHFGTEKNIQKNFWDSVLAYNTHLDSATYNSIKNYASWNARAYIAEITHNEVKEV